MALRQLPYLLSGCPPLDKPGVVNGIGASATPEQVAKRVARDVAFLQPDNQKVIVCIDRESRTESAVAFAAQVSTALDAELPRVGGTSANVAVVVADRAFEAWILADVAGICSSKSHRKKPANRCYEGHMRAKRGSRWAGYHYGDDVLRDVLGRYEKTRDGPELFAMLDFDRALIPCGHGGRGSASLRSLIEALSI
jgi:hypothetical protein